MTTKELIPILEAFVAKKEIECFDFLSKEYGWTLVDNHRFDCWNLSRFNFRIKATPKTYYIRWCDADVCHCGVGDFPLPKRCQFCDTFSFTKP